MAEPAGGLGLALEALRKLDVLREARNGYFERDRSGSSKMRGLEDRAHGAAAELTVDAILLVQHGPGQRFQSHRVILPPLSPAAAESLVKCDHVGDDGGLALRERVFGSVLLALRIEHAQEIGEAARVEFVGQFDSGA